MTFKVTINELN